MLQLNCQTLPDKNGVYDFLADMRNLFYPGFFAPEKQDEKEILLRSKKRFLTSICSDLDNMNAFFSKTGELKQKYAQDVSFFYDSDPAADSLEEIISTYPGFTASFYHRIAHELYLLGLKVVARVISEYAHSMTGIDIHPGATIGSPFFIDHGTGIVIGETSVIGHHVKIYQGVTLGGLSLAKGHALNGVKRHPTIGNYVTIYSGASILGGDVVIGDHVVIGSNVFLTESVPANMRVRIAKPELEILPKTPRKPEEKEH